MICNSPHAGLVIMVDPFYIGIACYAVFVTCSPLFVWDLSRTNIGMIE